MEIKCIGMYSNWERKGWEGKPKQVTNITISLDGELNEWIEEYLKKPDGSRLHKNIVRVLKEAMQKE